MSEELSLPSSSYGELVKIVKGYANLGEDVALDALAKLIGMNRTRISANNKFLAEMGLIQGGKRKSATTLGKKLGRALDHNQEADIRSSWQEAIRGNEKVSNLITTVRIKAGMSSEDLSSHILYVSGQKKTKGSNAGARALVDILVTSGLLQEGDGQLSVSAPSGAQALDTAADVIDVEQAASGSPQSDQATRGLPSSITPPTVVINIQLQLPETEKVEIYENLFKALRKHLLTPDE